MEIQNPNSSKAADYMKRKPKKKGAAPEDEDWSLIKEYYDIGIELRRPFEQRWILDLAFLAGRQYVFFNSSAHTLQQLSNLRRRRGIVDNKLLPRWRRLVSDAIRLAPVMRVIPNSADPEDIKAARIGDKLLLNFWSTNKMQKKWRLLNGWKYAIGGAFLSDRWDPLAGPVTIDKDGNIVYEGDVDTGVWSYFEVILPASNLGEVELHHMPWLARAKWRHLTWIQKNYKRGSLVSSEGTKAPFLDITSMFAGTTMQGTSSRVAGALVIELFVLPGAEFPKGLFVTGANGIVLNRQDFPFTTYSMEHFKDNDLPGIFWGKAINEEAIPLQNRWNRLTNDIDEYNEFAKGKLLVPESANLRVSMNDKNWEIIHYKPVMGLKPEQLTLKGLPSTYGLLLQEVHNSFQDLYSQHEVTRGTNRSDIRSGEMTSLLLEQDSHASVPTRSSDEESLSSFATRVLRRIQEGYQQQRMIRVTGREGEFDIFAFQGSDLRENCDVHVKLQTGYSDSRVAREQQIISRFQSGLYGPPEDPEVRRHVMNMLEDAVVKDIYSDVRLDESVARWENEQLVQGKPVFVNAYDNHSIHQKEHDLFKKSLDYQRVKLENPKAFITIESFFMEHQGPHAAFLKEQMAQMIQRQIAIKEGGKV